MDGKGAVKLNPDISRIKKLSIFRIWGFAPCPTKGLSDRPLETFGHKFLVSLEIPVLLA